MAKILALRELKSLKGQMFIDTYLANLEFISGHNHNNIVNILNSKTLPMLIPVRKAILDKTIKIAPEVKVNPKLSDRKSQVIKDIIYLGPYSFLAKENDLPSPVTSPAQPDQEEEPVVIQVIQAPDKPTLQPNWDGVAEVLKNNNTWGAETLSAINDSTQSSITNKTASGGLKCSDTNNSELLNRKVNKLE